MTAFYLHVYFYLFTWLYLHMWPWRNPNVIRLHYFHIVGLRLHYWVPFMK